jgi:hypothetical protein
MLNALGFFKHSLHYLTLVFDMNVMLLQRHFRHIRRYIGSSASAAVLDSTWTWKVPEILNHTQAGVRDELVTGSRLQTGQLREWFLWMSITRSTPQRPKRALEYYLISSSGMEAPSTMPG